MAQHGQVLKLAARRPDGKAVWAYRYRVDGSRSIRAIAAQLGRVTGGMVVFGAATGLRPAELVALERRDIDRGGRAVYVRRQLVCGQIKRTKTRRSLRAGPLQAVALEALDQLPESNGPLLFPAARGGYIDMHNFRARDWRPAQVAAGIEPIRRPYDLRHTYATFALRAGISIFDLSRFMGASLAMIDKHYGHLARDGREHAAAVLDAYARETAAWTQNGRRRSERKPAPRQRPRHC
jgi:integrase